jgi:hypothetical protein
MRGVILQPGYLPWMGFFNQMLLSDVFIYLDNVQFDKRGWRNRNRIKSPNGPVWLTVPVIQKGRFCQEIRHTKIDNTQNWPKKHLNSIAFNYRTAPYFSVFFKDLECILNTSFESLIDLDITLIEKLKEWLNIESLKTLKSSDMESDTDDKTGRLVALCKQAGITEYISGPLCRNYLDVKQFERAGIRVYLHEYTHPEYVQLHGAFMPFMATIDLIMNEGENSLNILRQESALVSINKADSTD